jgi:hypothetical protein
LAFSKISEIAESLFRNPHNDLTFEALEVEMLEHGGE